jgi:hypothetical protein
VCVCQHLIQDQDLLYYKRRVKHKKRAHLGYQHNCKDETLLRASIKRWHDSPSTVQCPSDIETMQLYTGQVYDGSGYAASVHVITYHKSSTV